MSDFICINPSRLLEVSKRLTTNEIKVLLLILGIMKEEGHGVFINSTENRKKLAEMGFNRTPERISSVLSALVTKEVLKREVQGVFSLKEKTILLDLEDPS